MSTGTADHGPHPLSQAPQLPAINSRLSAHQYPAPHRNAPAALRGVLSRPRPESILSRTSLGKRLHPANRLGSEWAKGDPSTVGTASARVLSGNVAGPAPSVEGAPSKEVSGPLFKGSRAEGSFSWDQYFPSTTQDSLLPLESSKTKMHFCNPPLKSQVILRFYNMPVKKTGGEGIWEHWWGEVDTGSGTGVELVYA